MARLRSKHSALKILSCKFGGLAKHTPLSPGGAEDMCNFRILPGGILKTRMGYQLKKHFSSSEKVRGVWEGTIGEVSLLLIVAGDKIYRLDGSSMTETVVGTIANAQTNVHFCAYLDDLYLLDGSNIYHYSPSTQKFIEMEAYVPLYGYQWSPTSYGDVYEDINLLSPRLRVHYFNADASNVFRLPYFADAVDSVWADGKTITNYTFTPGSNQITINASNPPSFVEIGFVANLNEELRQKILATQLSFIYSRDGQNRLFLWGKDARVFCSKNVTDYMLSASRAMYPRTSSLYFCSDDILFLGDSTHPITTMCPFHDTVLAFCANRIWNISFEKGEISVTLSASEIGCASPFGAIPYKNTVLAVMGGEFYRISSLISHPEQLSFDRLSVGMEGKLASDFSERVQLFRNIADGEIWLRDPQNKSGEVWVWNTESDEWYRFDNIPATLFFKIHNGVGFAQNNGIFLFDRNYHTDSDMPISAFYKSAYLDLGTPDIPRRSMHAYLYSTINGGNNSLLFETERSGKLFSLVSPISNADAQLQTMRLLTHRHRFLRFTISTNATTPAEFYRLDIYSLP